MRLDHHARLERTLDRHRDAVLGRGPQGQGALHRRDQILVTARHAEAAHEHADRWIAHSENLPDLGVARLHLKAAARIDTAELIASLRAHAHGPLAVTPNYLLRGEPIYDGGPFDVPRPHPALSKPAATPLDVHPVTVAVLDTGVTPHPWFSSATWFRRTTADQADQIPQELDFALESESGHGTFVVGTVLRQAPSAFIRTERVLGDDGICDELELLHGLARLQRGALADGTSIDVLNLSLGGYTLDDQPSPVLAEALARFGRGTVIVAAAGNHGSNRPFWPAALKTCVAVGALNSDGTQRAAFSNHGWWVDACAVGEHVVGPFLTDAAAGGEQYAGYASWSGTSFAAPRVAGAIAALAAEKQLTAAEAAELLFDPATSPRRPDLGVVVV
jgi:subtilisin family serine protease